MGRHFLLWLLWESWEWESGWAEGRTADNWRGCTWVAESISSLVPYDIQESKSYPKRGGQGGDEEGHLSSHCAFTSCSGSFAFFSLSSLFFLFFLLSTMSAKRPIILRQSFSPGCGGLTFALATRCPSRHCLSLFSLHRDHPCSPLATRILPHQSFRQGLLPILENQWELLNISILCKMRLNLCMMQHYYNRKAAENFSVIYLHSRSKDWFPLRALWVLIYFLSWC